MWQFMKEMGYYNSGYDGDVSSQVTIPTRNAAHLLTLDPITTPVCNMRRARAASVKFPFIAEALNIISCDELLRSSLCESDAADTKIKMVTSEKWVGHLAALASFGVVVQCDGRDAVALSSYFSVPKPDGLGRSIFNGRRVSKMFRVPPSVNLPYLPRTLRRLSQLSASGSISLATGDIRHFFHQIEISVEIQKYFVILCQGKYYKWTRVPMGWSWSPYIAQALATLLLLHREESDEMLFDSDITQLPEYLHQKDGNGFACVYYDNFFVAGCDHSWVESVYRRVKSNVTSFGITMKEWFLLTPKNLRTQTVTYMGVEMRVLRKRSRQDDFPWKHEVEWRIAPSKVCEPLPSSESFSARMAARWIGKCMWHHTITLKPLVWVHELIDILRVVSTHQRLRGWDDMSFVCDFMILRKHVDVCRENAWIAGMPATPTTSTIFACSDSSDSTWGYIRVDDPHGTERGFEWSECFREKHIFIKELLAAIWTIKAVATLGAHIVIGIDNTAAASCIDRRYSSNSMANGFLLDFDLFVTRHELAITVARVTSQDNAADPISRGKCCTQLQRNNALIILNAATKGKRMCIAVQRNVFPQSTVNGYRHKCVVSDSTTDGIVGDDGEPFFTAVQEH